IKVGASDYLIKTEYSHELLVRTIRYSLERKRTEQELKQQEKNLQAIFDVAPVGMLLVDENTVVAKINDAGTKVVGKSSSEMTNLQPGESFCCIHLADDPRGCGHSPHCSSCPIRSTFEQVLSSAQAVHGVECQLTLLVGQRKVRPWLELSAEPLTVEGKRCVVVAISNITERKLAEEKLRESKSNLAMAQKMARIGSWEYNSVTNKCIWSDETYRLFGFEPQEFEITYKYYLDAILHPEDRERVVEEVNNALEHDDEYEGEYRIITKDGRVLTMHSIAKLYRDSNGNTVRMIGSIQDITERKQVEDELKKSNERFRLALDNSKITVFNQDSELRYTWVYNPAPGLSPDFVVGKTDHDLVPDEDARVLTEMKRRVLETGVLEHGTIRFTIEGVPSYHDLNVEPLRDENERIVGVIGVSTNITDIKHAEGELKRSEERFRKLIE
ncbi:hypothetical protein LCGC14_2675170, partial [marine sediment metagenome]